MTTTKQESRHSAKQKQNKNLVGINGWLAWYVVGLSLGTAITIFNLFNGGIGMSSSDIYDLNQYQFGLGDAFNKLTTLENIALVAYIALLVSGIVLILRKKRLAKPIAIAGLIFGIAYTTVDYITAYYLFESANLTQYVQSELNGNASYIIRNLTAACVWIPYFLTSKRVKATLTK